MGVYLLAILCVTFSLAFVDTRAAMTPGETYWNSMLPNTAMPRAVSNILPPSWDHTLMRKTHGSSNSEENGVVHDQRLMFYERDHHILETESKGVRHDQRLMFYERDHHVLEAENKEAIHDQRLIFYGRKQYSRSSADKIKVLINPPSAPWFLEKDLYPGKQMEMEIPRPDNDGYIFLPRPAADSIPFSSAEKGEVRTCVTSLESMIDFAIQHLGKNIQAVSTEAEKDTKLLWAKVELKSYQ